MDYQCIKEFELSKWDSDHDCFSDEIMTIEIGSQWIRENSSCIIGGEIFLSSKDNTEWIEISKNTLNSYFDEI